MCINYCDSRAHYLMEFASTTWASPFTMTLFSPGDRWAWTTLLTSAHNGIDFALGYGYFRGRYFLFKHDEALVISMVSLAPRRST